MKSKTIKLADSEVSNFSRPYVIAEIGANHNGDIELAKSMIDSAVECGADAVKFQSWTPTSLVSKEEYDRNQSYDDCKKKHFGSLREMVDKYALTTEDHHELKLYCDSKGVAFCSTPFSEGEADLLEELDVPFFKIASMDITNIRLLKHVAAKRKPVIISTGMSTMAEIDNAITAIESTGNQQIVILHCISIYPPAMEDVNLANISMLMKAYDYPIGFSDHSIGSALPLASVALGACVIEKHYTIDKNLPGWDHAISADPAELKVICEESRNIHTAMGSLKRIVSKAELAKKEKFRRSVVLTRDLPKGHIIQASDFTFKRPGTGISPEMEMQIIGRVMKVNKEADELLNWNDLG
ncbi:polysaccharide biosynthesis protein [Corallincola luteus]|uniref:Polysaccharide biosynthesis protein n=1 Tax=Corallincola luteus TaxID=1775177 RepID=A0ABY2AQF4_9GAMM|nr:N-acetylneuraminate synthase family protein [Corallincola luteus]TCI05420.1 polysaccharide biosynthesis protein [Corallincola luteus]